MAMKITPPNSPKKKSGPGKRTWAILLFLLLAIIAGGAAYSFFLKPDVEVVAATQVQTAVARRGELTIFATGAGEIIPAREIGIGFDESGTLTELLVKVGDKVEENQVLARLKTSNTEESIASSIASAELSVLKAQLELDDIYDSWQMDAAQALLAIETAQKALDDLQNTDLQLVKAQLAIIDAQSYLETVTKDRQRLDYARCLDSTIESYEAKYYMALNRYEQLKETYNNKYAPLDDNDPDRLNALATLLSAEEGVQTAVANLNWCKGTATEEEITAADAEVVLAQTELAETQETYHVLLNGPSLAEIAVAEAKLADAQRQYEKIRNAPDPDQIALAEAQVSNAKTQLELAKEEKVFLDLVAPMKGTVMSISANVGERIGASAILTLADLEQPLLEIYLDETDMDKAIVGYEAEVVFDALPDETFTGHIIQVNPSLTRSGNLTMIQALVQLDPDSFAKPQTLPVGLNASVDVIGGRAENAVLVPVEALRDLGDGDYAVFVMVDGTPKLRSVTVGLIDYTYAEITSGLEVGEVVTTGVVETGG